MSEKHCVPPGMKCAVQIKFDLIYSSALRGDLSSGQTFLSESTNPPPMNEFSIDSIAGAFHLCCPVVLCLNVSIEKCLSDSAVVIGVAIMVFRSDASIAMFLS